MTGDAIATLLKFAYDGHATAELRDAMLALGLLVAALGLLMAVFGELVRRRIGRDLSLLASQLGIPDLASDLLALKLTVYVFTVFVLTSLLGGVIVLLR